MMALVSEYLPGYPLYFSQGFAWVSSLQGPTATDASQFGRTFRPTTNYWDIQEFSLMREDRGQTREKNVCPKAGCASNGEGRAWRPLPGSYVKAAGPGL